MDLNGNYTRRLPQVGIIANNLLTRRLINHGYYQVKQTPGLWRYMWRPISFTLVVDGFGISYIGQEHADHLMSALKCIMKNHNILVR